MYMFFQIFYKHFNYIFKSFLIYKSIFLFFFKKNIIQSRLILPRKIIQSRLIFKKKYNSKPIDFAPQNNSKPIDI